MPVRKILAVSSGGGHWIQLRRILPALEGHEVVFATAHTTYAEEVPGRALHAIGDAHRGRPLRLLWLFFRLTWVMLRERPDVVISTGAAPGCIAVVLGRLLAARTIWLDSLANVQRMSLSGRLVRPFCSLWLTQWPHLANPGGPDYAGRVL